MRTIIRLTAVVALFAAGSAFAFTWNPDSFPPGSHSYTWTMTVDQGDGPQTATITIAITQKGDTYDTTTTTQVTQTGVAKEDLSSAALGGSMMGTLAIGPMMVFYGPAFMMLPALLGNEDIHVRSEPVRVAGMGSIYMDKAETYAGHKCVVLRLQMDDGSPPIEMALAEDLPFPCYSKYGEEGDQTTLELTQVK
ncbi:MAG TPA: hypothetical protein VKA00_03180 [Trueperaceae bacterium]|nr:hypothetical protein [Trueperaceae bacterium]